MNILTALIVLSVALLAIYVKRAYIYKDKVVPEPGSLFIIIPDAVNGYGMDIITDITEKDYHVLGIVRTLADAEFLRSSGLGKLDALVWTKADTSGGIVKNEMPVASSLKINEYAAMNITVSGIVAVLTPHHFYDKSNQSEMSGFEFSVETITEVLMSLILIQEMLMNEYSKMTECKEKPMRIVLVAPYIPPALYAIPHSLNTTEMAELVVIRALDAAVAEARKQFTTLGFSVSLVYSPSRYAPSETLLQVTL